MRLVDGPNDALGRVQVRENGVWGEVCDDRWGLEDAQVICRMLCYKSVFVSETSSRRILRSNFYMWRCVADMYLLCTVGDCIHTRLIVYCSPDNARALLGGSYGNRTSSVYHLDDPRCDGTEEDIFDCDANPGPDNCAITEAAAVNCMLDPPDPSPCEWSSNQAQSLHTFQQSCSPWTRTCR